MIAKNVTGDVMKRRHTGRWCWDSNARPAHAVDLDSVAPGVRNKVHAGPVDVATNIRARGLWKKAGLAGFAFFTIKGFAWIAFFALAWMEIGTP